VTPPLPFLDFQAFLLFRILHGIDRFFSLRLQHWTADQRGKGGDRRAGGSQGRERTGLIKTVLPEI